ncbi:MAG: signal transduction protein [Verrucomicrobiales bacterium]|nr:signal transduction protein [Verrucomicrobiales bacterium]
MKGNSVKAWANENWSEGMSLQAIDGLLDSVEALPLSPYPLQELLKALTDPESDLSEVVRIITFDPILTAKLLQLCNSAFISRSAPANTVGEAISQLGFQTVYRVVASIKGPQIFQLRGGACGFAAEQSWKHSVLSALNAQFIGEDFGEDSGVLFTAGLLHDLGKVILGMSLREKYGCVVSAARVEQKPLWELERAAFGTDHAEVGARLLERWQFSPELVCSVRFHHHPHEAQALERFPAIIQVASALSHAACPEEGKGRPLVQAEAGQEIFGWTLEEMGQYGQRMEENKEILKLLMRMGK